MLQMESIDNVGTDETSHSINQIRLERSCREHDSEMLFDAAERWNICVVQANSNLQYNFMKVIVRLGVKGVH